MCYFFWYLLVCLKNISFYNSTVSSAVHLLNLSTSSTSLFVLSISPSLSSRAHNISLLFECLTNLFPPTPFYITSNLLSKFLQRYLSSFSQQSINFEVVYFIKSIVVFFGFDLGSMYPSYQVYYLKLYSILVRSLLCVIPIFICHSLYLLCLTSLLNSCFNMIVSGFRLYILQSKISLTNSLNVRLTKIWAFLYSISYQNYLCFKQCLTVWTFGAMLKGFRDAMVMEYMATFNRWDVFR